MTATAPRGILKPPTVFPSERELRSYEEPRNRSRSRDRRHADEALQLVVPALQHREKSGSSHSIHSRRPARSRRRSQSRSRRHVRWSDPIEFVVSDGQDMLSRELRHRRSSLPGILEDTRTLFKESLREQDKKHEETRASSSSSSSSRRRPQLKSAASSPDVGRGSQDSHPPKLVQAQAPVHAPTPISSEHRKRRTSLPNGLEAAVKSPSHALWLPHPNDQQESDHPTPNVNGHSPPHPNGFPSPHLSISSQSHASGHSRQRSSERLPHHSASHVQPIPQTPRRYEPSQLPPHLHEQPNLHGRGLAPPPPVTFMNQVASPMPRPVSQITTSTQRSSKSSKSSKSSPPEERPSPLALPAPPLASPNPPAKLSPTPSTKQINEPATPRSIKSSLFSFPTVDDVFSKEDTSHSKMSIRRLFGLSTPKHEPRKLDEEDKPSKKALFSKERTKEARRQEPEQEVESTRPRTISNSFLVHPPTREPLHRARHSFDLGTFSLLDDMHMRWSTATARHFLPVLTPGEIQASHLTLHLNPALTTIHWDIRHPPTAVWSVVPGRKTRIWSGHDEPATVPLVPTLRIMSPYFPWVITARNPNGVTCGDVLSAIHASARQLVWRGEFEQLRTVDKNRLAAGYHANRPANGGLMSADAPFEAGSWLVRADWLGQYTVLRGMSANETRNKYGQPGEVMLNMYLVENKKEKPLLVRP